MNCPTCKLEAFINTANGKEFYVCGECRQEVPNPDKANEATDKELQELFNKLSMTKTELRPGSEEDEAKVKMHTWDRATGFPRLMTRAEQLATDPPEDEL